MRKRRGFGVALTRYLLFFFLVGATVTAAVMIYETVRQAYDGDTGKISLIMLVVCFALTLSCSTIDALRSRFTTDAALENILDATERITRGDFKVRLTPRHSYKSFDDFDVIMENLNKMAEELSKNELLKNDFISNVSHEIKTPLAIIQNYAVALQSDEVSREKRVEYVKTIVKASKRLTALVTNVLKLNKLENQTFSPEIVKVKLDEALAQAIFDFEDLFEQKNLTVETDIDEMTAFSEPSYLEIIWNNLLSNAVKFTPEGGRIFVSLKEKNGKVVAKFTDSGVGMNEETGRRIFDKFYQGDTSHQKEGNGLGLALVKRVVYLLGGEISVESELGKGSTFTVVLNGIVHE